MSNSDELSWEKFGFPFPGFMPVWKPAEGLMKALAERKLPFEAKWDFENLVQKEKLKLFETVSGQFWCRNFDDNLKKVAVKYMNHTKIKEVGSVDFSTIMWTWEELLTAAAEGDKNKIAYPEKGDLSPEWNFAWLKQRFRAINLLLYAPVPYKYEYLSGSVHNGQPTSTAEAVKDALSSVTPYTTSGFPCTSVSNIYGYDHGWKEGTYCCDITVVKKIFAELPENFSGSDNVYLYLKITGADGNDDSFKGGKNLSVGNNLLTADANGVFIEFDYSNAELAAFAGTPRKDRVTRGGWMATVCQAFANYTEVFHFVEKEETINEDLL